MNRSQHRSTAPRFRPHWLVLGMAGAALALAGCPGVNNGTGNGNDSTGNDNAKPGNAASRIVNIASNFPLSAIAPPVAIEYVVADEFAASPGVEVHGFYRQVADNSPNAEPIGEGDVIIATGLPATGGSLFFSFDPSVTGLGFFRVGIVVLVNGVEVDEEVSTGTINVQGPPDPEFRLPVEDVTDVIRGTTVRILFDAQDPEGDVRWRLFYLTETERVTKDTTSPDQLGTEIATGASNVGEAFLSTNRLALGTYEIGVSAVDSGDSIIGAVNNGRIDQIVTVFGKLINVVDPPPNPADPTLFFTSPPDEGEIVLHPEFYDIEFNATVDPSVQGATVELFWDNNRTAGDGVTTIVTGLPIDDTSFSYRVADRCVEGVEEVEFFIGGTVLNVNPPLTEYAGGSLKIICEITLDVTAPDTALPFEPGAPVNIEWTTNAPVDSGTVDVFAVALDDIGQEEGPEIPIETDEPLTLTTASFTRNDPGRFKVYVRIELEDGTEIQRAAPQAVQFSSLPGVLWLGSLAQEIPRFDGAIFQGVNFADNAGTSFASAGDINGDGFDDFVIAARYGKSFFDTGGGVGPGEAYLVFGRNQKYSGARNLNSVGTEGLPGAVFVGIRTPQGNDDTDGMAAVTALPDLDGDGRAELMFGFPNTDSRGHNVSIFQDGVRDPDSLCTLERHEQFLRGGVVIVSSHNRALQGSGDPVINLDLVGQDFVLPRAQPDANQALTDWFDDRFALNDGVCEGTCADPVSGGTPFDSTPGMNIGFNDALADDYIAAMVMNGCAEPDWYPIECQVAHCRSRAIVEPTSPVLSSGVGLSGFYPLTLEGGDGEDERLNLPREPYGARIIGIGTGDQFGTSVTLSNATGSGGGDIIISSPNRTARGILLGENDDDPSIGGEVDGLENPPGIPTTLNNSGVAYMFSLRNLWTTGTFTGSAPVPPFPHQYMVGQPSHTLIHNNIARIPNIDAIRIAGNSGDRIRNIIGIDDFNVDGLNDFAIGAPTANAGQGRVYIAFRRLAGVEGDFVLNKLELDPNDPDRLAGVLIESNSLDSLGASLATGVDFNGDGVSDLVIGSPTASAGIGEIIVVFGDPNFTSPLGGISIQDLLTGRDAQNRPRAARITGNALDSNGQFGFNVATPGDVNGDGFNDLLVAAPNATPRFDENPNDAVDLLTIPGVDQNLDGVPDDVSGPFNSPDGQIDSFDELTAAGVVYVISGANRLDLLDPLPEISIGIESLGSENLRGFLIAGRREGDRLGGGDAGDVALGGIPEKTGRGRSFGLAGAGDVNNDGRDDFLIGSVLADPRIDPNTGEGTQNAGEAYLIYGAPIP